MEKGKLIPGIIGLVVGVVIAFAVLSMQEPKVVEVEVIKEVETSNESSMDIASSAGDADAIESLF